MKRGWSFALAAVLLAACGGGGGASGTPPAGPPPPGNAPIQTQSVQRAVATSALSVPAAASASLTFGSLAGASVARQVMSEGRRLTANWRSDLAAATAPRSVRLASVTYSACSAGSETAVVNVSSTEVQLYARNFYDAACTHLFQDIFLDMIATSQTSLQATGTLTTYSPSGQITDYATLAMTITVTSSTSGSFSIKSTDAPSATATPTASIGIACTIASASSIGCGFGAVARAPAISQDLGASLAFNANLSTAGTTSTVNLNGSVSAFNGAAGALSVTAATFPAWNITGGNLLDSATFNGSASYSTSGALTAMSFVVADATMDATVTVSAGGSPVVVTGTIKETDTGATVATFRTDAAGNGTITYSNGSTAPIVNWHVQG